MIFSISRSSTSASCAALIAPFSRLARASFKGAVRNRLPTMSARNGGLLLVIGRSSPRLVLRGLLKQAGPVGRRQLKSALEKVARPRWATSQRPGSFLDSCHDCDAALDDRDRIGLHWHHAGRRYHFAGADIELTIVEIAFDN